MLSCFVHMDEGTPVFLAAHRKRVYLSAIHFYCLSIFQKAESLFKKRIVLVPPSTAMKANRYTVRHSVPPLTNYCSFKVCADRFHFSAWRLEQGKELTNSAFVIMIGMYFCRSSQLYGFFVRHISHDDSEVKICRLERFPNPNLLVACISDKRNTVSRNSLDCTFYMRTNWCVTGFKKYFDKNLKKVCSEIATKSLRVWHKARFDEFKLKNISE